MSVLHAELQGLWGGITVVRRLYLTTNIWVERGSLLAIQVLAQDWLLTSSSRMRQIHNVKNILASFAGRRASHVYREGNKATDWLYRVSRAISERGRKV